MSDAWCNWCREEYEYRGRLSPHYCELVEGRPSTTCDCPGPHHRSIPTRMPGVAAFIRSHEEFKRRHGE